MDSETPLALVTVFDPIIIHNDSHTGYSKSHSSHLLSKGGTAECCICPLQGWAAILREAGPFQSLCYLHLGTKVLFRGRGLGQSGAVSADLGSEANDNFSEFFF